MQTLVITPTYNEAKNLAPFVTAVLAVDSTLDIVVVDDQSPDGTGAVAEAMAATTPRVHVLHRPGKQGLGPAYIAGIQYALARPYEYIVLMDADLSHRPQDLPRLLCTARHADLVIGSRNIAGGRVENWTLLRHCLSKGGSLYARTLLRLPVKDCTSGFLCFQRSALQSIDIGSMATHGFGFHVEIKYRCHRAGLRIVEAPIIFPDRTHGRSKMSHRIAVEALRFVWSMWYRDTTATARTYVAWAQEKTAACAGGARTRALLTRLRPRRPEALEALEALDGRRGDDL